MAVLHLGARFAIIPWQCYTSVHALLLFNDSVTPQAHNLLLFHAVLHISRTICYYSMTVLHLRRTNCYYSMQCYTSGAHFSIIPWQCYCYTWGAHFDFAIIPWQCYTSAQVSNLIVINEEF